jgi:hypothetical protein
MQLSNLAHILQEMLHIVERMPISSNVIALFLKYIDSFKSGHSNFFSVFHHLNFQNLPASKMKKQTREKTKFKQIF